MLIADKQAINKKNKYNSLVFRNNTLIAGVKINKYFKFKQNYYNLLLNMFLIKSDYASEIKLCFL